MLPRKGTCPILIYINPSSFFYSFGRSISSGWDLLPKWTAVVKITFPFVMPKINILTVLYQEWGFRKGSPTFPPQSSPVLSHFIRVLSQILGKLFPWSPTKLCESVLRRCDASCHLLASCFPCRTRLAPSPELFPGMPTHSQSLVVPGIRRAMFQKVLSVVCLECPNHLQFLSF